MTGTKRGTTMLTTGRNANAERAKLENALRWAAKQFAAYRTPAARERLAIAARRLERFDRDNEKRPAGSHPTGRGGQGGPA